MEVGARRCRRQRQEKRNVKSEKRREEEERPRVSAAQRARPMRHEFGAVIPDVLGSSLVISDNVNYRPTLEAPRLRFHYLCWSLRLTILRYLQPLTRFCPRSRSRFASGTSQSYIKRYSFAALARWRLAWGWLESTNLALQGHCPVSTANSPRSQ